MYKIVISLNGQYRGEFESAAELEIENVISHSWFNGVLGIFKSNGEGLYFRTRYLTS